MQHLSIKFRLSLTLYFILFLVMFLGVFSIAALNDFNGVADQLRDRWLPNTRFLGDLNNYTSDFRAAEGTLLLASSPADIAATQREMDEIDRNVVKSQRGYERTYHDNKEIYLYKRFLEDWADYRKIVDQVIQLVHENKKEAGIELYKTKSRTTYNAASDTLGLLTDINAAKDEEASDRAADTYNKVRLLSAVAMSLAVMLVAAAVLFIRRSISAPMLSLAGIMHRLADNDTQVEIKGMERRDEVGEMTRALVVFRNNVVELAESRQGLLRQASMLEEKLQHEQNLMIMQRNFISMASHEFRTPLTIIDGHAQRLMKTQHAMPSEQIAERAGKIRNGVRQMTSLIDNLINSVRLFEGQPELYFHPTGIDLAALLHDVCEEYRDIASGIRIEERLALSPPHVHGDSKLLTQMFGNLLSNAIKYSTSGGIIEVSAWEDSGQVIASVRDHGIGIPVKDLESVFDRYVRGSNATSISGTGIGLYLARMIMELHRGTITAHSIEGQGATFTVTLPEAKSAGY